MRGVLLGRLFKYGMVHKKVIKFFEALRLKSISNNTNRWCGLKTLLFEAPDVRLWKNLLKRNAWLQVINHKHVELNGQWSLECFLYITVNQSCIVACAYSHVLVTRNYIFLYLHLRAFLYVTILIVCTKE